MTETARKPVEEMTAAECRAELAEINERIPEGVSPFEIPRKVADLRERLAYARESTFAVEKEPEPGEVLEPTPEDVEDEVGRALALREQTPAPMTALPTPSEFNATMALAATLCDTTFVPEAYRGRKEDVVAAILFGREIGLGPMNALRDIYMIDGRPALAAHRQLALLRKGGVVMVESESTAEVARITAKRLDTGEVMTVEFTMEEAQKIQTRRGLLVAKDNWKNYPADMLWARCVGRLTRRLGPDLLNGLPPYVAEEVADFSGWGVEYGGEGAVTLRQAPPAAQRKQAGRVETPRSWAEINAWVEPYGVELGWGEWVRDASELLFGTREFRDLKPEQRTTLGQKASGAIINLRDLHDPAELPPPTREEVQAAWASVLDGISLPGPGWRMAPEETDLEPYEAEGVSSPVEAASSPVQPPEAGETPGASSGGGETIEDAEWTASPEEQAEADDIPFGDE